MSDKTEAQRLADAPERIWLQVCDDADCVESFASHDGVTWCQDKVHDTDIEYVRADRAAPPAESERIAALENDIHSCHPGCTRAGCVNERLRDAIDEQKRTIDALMCGMPDDGTTPVIRRIAALEADRDSWAEQASQRVKDCERFIERIAALEAALAERDRVIEIAQEMAEYLRNSSICQADTEAAEEVIRAIEEVQR